MVDGPVREATYIEPTMAAIHAALKQAYPARTSASPATTTTSRGSCSPPAAAEPPTYGVLLDRKQVVELGIQRPWIKPSSIGEQRWVTYEARDGLKVTILDLPPAEAS